MIHVLIKLHTEAIKAINQKSFSLISNINQINLQPEYNNAKSQFYSDVIITDKDIIGEIEHSFSDITGQEKGKGFIHNNLLYGFIHNDYLEFIRVLQFVHHQKLISDIASYDFIKKHLFHWCKDIYSKSISIDFFEYLSLKLDEFVDDYKILIPIPYTTSCNPFRIGKIYFETLTEEMVDAWFPYTNKDENEAKKLEQYKIELRKKYQGYLIGTFVYSAEPHKAQEIAYYHINNSLSFLRLFSSANHIPGLLNGTYQYGNRMMRTKEYMCIKSNEMGITTTSSVLDKGLYFRIDQNVYSLLNNDTFQKYSNLLCKDEPNEFQKKLIECINIYSKNTLRYDFFDKLIYMLVSLETMLLKNNSEPIQQNIAERIAFLIGKTIDEKKEIIKTFKKIYAIRSEFIHHGESNIEETNLLKKLMEYTWLCFVKLIMTSDKYTTVIELIDALDTLKLS